MDPELHEIIQNLGAEPERHPRKARRTRALGWFVWILLAVGIASFISPWLGLPGWFVGLLSLGAASVLKRFQTRAKRMVSIGAATKLQQDPRPPVVYLRSFAKDAHSSSFEERLLRELDVVGPVIAIGRPGETLPPLGAYRLYPKPDQWREAVVRLMQLSGAVVLRGGKTEGVLWETARAREYVPPERLLIMLPGTNPEEPGYAHSEKEPARLEERYREFRELVQGNFPKGLPERSDGAGFVCFDVDWNPRLIGRTRTETRERPRRGAFVLGVCSFGVAWAYVFGAAFSKGDVDLKLLLGLLLVPLFKTFGWRRVDPTLKRLSAFGLSFGWTVVIAPLLLLSLHLIQRG